MSRIPPLPVEQWDPKMRRHMEGAGRDLSKNQYTATSIMAHAPHMAMATMAFKTLAAQGSRLSPRLLELVRLRLAFHNQCRSCMAMRFQNALDDGLTEDLVCSLEKPTEADDLTEAEKAALAYADIFAINHFAINDETFNKLRAHFDEAEIVELGMSIAFFFGNGRLFASWDMTETLPEVYQDKTVEAAPWKALGEVVVMR